MKIKTRGDEVDITLGTRFVEVYAGSRFGPVVFMEATSEPVVDGDMASWMARNIVTGEMVSYGVNLKHWKYSPTLCHIDSVVFNEKIMPFRPWPIEVVSKGVFANNKKFKRRKIEGNMPVDNRTAQVVKDISTKEIMKEKQAKELHVLLSSTRFNDWRYEIGELGEEISVIKQCIGGWWKQRYLVDENKSLAYEIMDEDMTFTNFTTDDIDWKSLESLSDYMIERARRLSALFPTFVSCFQNGVAKAVGVELTAAQQVSLIGASIVTVLGAPSVPMAGVITLAVLLTAMGLPTDYIGMFMAIDILCDMPKTLLNAYSVSCSAIIVARSEGETLNI